ncbi:ABC transporter permease [Pseudoclavibacter sp. RFBJ3]|uniref:ABC transporter permease n=2 Tax=Pseudoclavibacter TaxID=255204 RepID=UPI0015E473E8|nr:ABC transporter permease [Pseudoclavibacter sp. RFBJ3]
MRDVRMLFFQLRQFAANSYFLQLMLTATIVSVVMQYLVLAGSAQSPGGEELVWLRAGLVGAWTVATSAAGILGFQRFQGVLVPLFQSPLGESRALFPVIAATASFGVSAVPVAVVVSLIFGLPVVVSDVGVFLLGMVLFALGAVSMSLVVALLFVLTPNAITYEGLLAIPIILLSGIFGYPASVAPALEGVSTLIPIAPAIRVLESSLAVREFGALDAIASAVCSIVWLMASGFAMRSVARRVRRDASVEVS